MKIVSLNNETLGAVAARPVYDENMGLLVNTGARIDELVIENLRSRGYKYIYIQEEGTERVQPPETFSIEAGRKVAAEVKTTFQKVRSLSMGEQTTLKSVMSRMSLEDRFSNLIPKGPFRKNVKKLVSDIYYRNAETVSSYSLSMLGANPLSHSMDVTLLSILLGKKFSYSFKELTSLAMACLLHDTGLQLFPDIMEKPWFMLNDKEKELYQRHPALGFEILGILNCFPPVETQTVLQHHENQDGTGFPNNLTGTNDKPLKSPQPERGRIFRWAEIVAGADRYVQYCAGNLTDLPLPPIEAIAAVIEDSGTILNSAVVKELVKLVNIFPVGTPVKIADSMNSEIVGYEGLVLEENHEQMELPVVLLLRTRKGQKISPKRVNFANDKTAKLALSI
ncbi:MAG: HD domain-containing protein [FCB group bacterium]|nr:HD domain-containing protein [FCB group bacterium]